MMFILFTSNIKWLFTALIVLISYEPTHNFGIVGYPCRTDSISSFRPDNPGSLRTMPEKNIYERADSIVGLIGFLP